jgi:hypothetical protein
METVRDPFPRGLPVCRGSRQSTWVGNRQLVFGPAPVALLLHLIDSNSCHIAFSPSDAVEGREGRGQQGRRRRGAMAGEASHRRGAAEDFLNQGARSGGKNCHLGRGDGAGGLGRAAALGEEEWRAWRSGSRRGRAMIVEKGLVRGILLIVCLLSLAFHAGCSEQGASSSSSSSSGRPAGGVFRLFGGGRRTLKQAQVDPQPASVATDSQGRCTRDAVVNQRNPVFWIYAAGEGGLPQHGLGRSLLQTGGYPGSELTVSEWRGKGRLT